MRFKGFGPDNLCHPRPGLVRILRKLLYSIPNNKAQKYKSKIKKKENGDFIKGS